MLIFDIARDTAKLYMMHERRYVRIHIGVPRYVKRAGNPSRQGGMDQNEVKSLHCTYDIKLKCDSFDPFFLGGLELRRLQKPMHLPWLKAAIEITNEKMSGQLHFYSGFKPTANA